MWWLKKGEKVKLNDGRIGTIEGSVMGTCYYQVLLESGDKEIVHRNQLKKIKLEHLND